MLIRHLDTPEVCLEVLRNGTPPFSNPRGPSGGPQTGEHILGTPDVRLEGSQNPESGKCDPEECLEVVRNALTAFSTTPRSALVSDENALGANPSVTRGPPCDTPKMGLTQIRRIPEVPPCDTPKMRNPEKWSIPRSLLQVPENRESRKTGRGHADSLKPCCKTADSATLQYPSD